MKLYDYMATGKKIVTTKFPAAQKFKKIIYIANTEKNFTRYIENALKENNGRKKEERLLVASKNTWDHGLKSYQN